MSWEQAEIRELKVNRYIVIDDEPCRIISIQTSKPGKHGEAKARLEAVGICDEQKRSIVHPVTHKVRVPIIDKRKAQVLSTHGNVVQLMDLATYATFELPVLEEFQGKLASGQQIMYIEALGRRKLSSNCAGSSSNKRTGFPFAHGCATRRGRRAESRTTSASNTSSTSACGRTVGRNGRTSSVSA